ncbi:hypothetical protein A2U01_0013832 [Trifolium medium]|uniref:Uncharacterized protein n=1 Tax=Trifolium medium TaxID=97028 RepID=A0A392MZ98_9FABA|nr:hypothetical protein [Trifolium medium]
MVSLDSQPCPILQNNSFHKIDQSHSEPQSQPLSKIEPEKAKDHFTIIIPMENQDGIASDTPSSIHPLTINDLIISTKILDQVIQNQFMESIEVETSSLSKQLKSFKDITIIDPFPLPIIPYQEPYNFTYQPDLSNLPEPNLELLSNLILQDCRCAYNLRNRFVMPDEVIKEWDAVKAKIGTAIDKMKEFSLRDVKSNLPVLVEKIVENLEVARQRSQNFLTNYPHCPSKPELVVSTLVNNCSSSGNLKDPLEHSLEHLKGIQESEPVSVGQLIVFKEELASQKDEQMALVKTMNIMAED